MRLQIYQTDPPPSIHQITKRLRSRYTFTRLLSSGLLILQPQPARKEKDEDDAQPTLAEILRRVGRITPYLWPSKSRSLQLVAVCPDLS